MMEMGEEEDKINKEAPQTMFRLYAVDVYSENQRKIDSNEQRRSLDWVQDFCHLRASTNKKTSGQENVIINAKCVEEDF
ncbi:hypothetical protein ACHQM5_002177 [Ranunculus cassubicifolius]